MLSLFLLNKINCHKSNPIKEGDKFEFQTLLEKYNKVKHKLNVEYRNIYNKHDKIAGINMVVKSELVEKELISLDADIKNYLPEFSIKNRFEESKITISDLLENRAGIPGDDIDLFLKSNGKDYYAVLEYLKEQYTS